MEGRLQGALAQLARQFEEAQKKKEEVDARALPLIGLGIVLTEAAGWLAGTGPWINLLVLAIVLLFSAQVVWPVAKQAYGCNRICDEQPLHLHRDVHPKRPECPCECWQPATHDSASRLTRARNDPPAMPVEAGTELGHR